MKTNKNICLETDTATQVTAALRGGSFSALVETLLTQWLKSPTPERLDRPAKQRKQKEG